MWLDFTCTFGFDSTFSLVMHVNVSMVTFLTVHGVPPSLTDVLSGQNPFPETFQNDALCKFIKTMIYNTKSNK